MNVYEKVDGTWLLSKILFTPYAKKNENDEKKEEFGC